MIPLSGTLEKMGNTRNPYFTLHSSNDRKVKTIHISTLFQFRVT